MEHDMTDGIRYGQLAYEAYSRCMGAQAPAFHTLTGQTKRCWEEVAATVLEARPPEDLPYEPIRRLTADMRRAAETMSDAEVRYLIDLFYGNQENRKRGQNQLRAARADSEPSSFIAYIAGQVESFEGVCNSALQVVAKRTRTGRWLMELKGVSGVLTSGLLASLDVRKAATAASFWRFMGLDPSWEWLGKEKAQKLYADVREAGTWGRSPQELLPELARRVATHETGLLARVERQTRPKQAREAVRTLEDVRDELTRTQLINALATRPWNASLKTLQWKLMDCLVKVQNRDDAPYYCRIYQDRKAVEWDRNFSGMNHVACAQALHRNLTPLQRPWYSGQYDPQPLITQWKDGKSPSTWDLPKAEDGGVPMLPPGRIELRARRIAVKQFLADLHYCLYEETFGTPPVPNAQQQARGKTSFRPPPGWQETT